MWDLFMNTTILTTPDIMKSDLCNIILLLCSSLILIDRSSHINQSIPIQGVLQYTFRINISISWDCSSGSVEFLYMASYTGPRFDGTSYNTISEWTDFNQVCGRYCDQLALLSWLQMNSHTRYCLKMHPDLMGPFNQLWFQRLYHIVADAIGQIRIIFEYNIQNSSTK